MTRLTIELEIDPDSPNTSEAIIAHLESLKGVTVRNSSSTP